MILSKKYIVSSYFSKAYILPDGLSWPLAKVTDEKKVIKGCRARAGNDFIENIFSCIFVSNEQSSLQKSLQIKKKITRCDYNNKLGNYMYTNLIIDTLLNSSNVVVNMQHC